MVQHFGVVVDPGYDEQKGCSRGKSPHPHRPLEPHAGICQASLPLRIPSALPHENAGQGNENAEEGPIKRKPPPTLHPWLIAKEIGIGHVGEATHADHARAHMERTPQERICNYESDESKVANVLVRRDDVNEEGDYCEEGELQQALAE